jgi:hypothetical protein
VSEIASYGTCAPTPPLDALMAYENDRLLRRYMDDFGVEWATAETRFHGFKQFVAVYSTMEGDIVTSDAIDGVWHTFLLFTREYDRFCRVYVGEYLHHEPFEMPKPQAYIATRKCAERLFGPLSTELWPVNAKGKCSSGSCRGDRPTS